MNHGLKTTLTLCAGFLAVASAMGCVDEADATGEVVTDVDFDIALKAVEHGAGGDDNNYEANVHFDSVSSCIYKRGTPSLAVTLSGGPDNALDVYIDGFDDVGTYAAEGDNTINSSVTFRVLLTSLSEGMDDATITLGTWVNNKTASYPCEINVIGTNLPKLAIVDATTTGWATLKVTCDNALGGSQLGPVDGTLEPTSIEFTVSDCEAYDQ